MDGVLRTGALGETREPPIPLQLSDAVEVEHDAVVEGEGEESQQGAFGSLKQAGDSVDGFDFDEEEHSPLTFGNAKTTGVGSLGGKTGGSTVAAAAAAAAASPALSESSVTGSEGEQGLTWNFLRKGCGWTSKSGSGTFAMLLAVCNVQRVAQRVESTEMPIGCACASLRRSAYLLSH